MAVNPAIALGVKGIELQDPLAQYGRVMAIQQAQQQNALANMQMRQAEREVEQQNRLREFLPTVTAENRNQLLGYGAAGRQVYESMLKGEKDLREADNAAANIAATRMKEARNLLPSVNTPESYANWRSYTLQHLPGLASVIPEQYSQETVLKLMMDADKALERHFVTQNLGGASQVVSMPKYGQGVAQVVPGSYAEDVPLPANVQAQKLQQSAASAPRFNLSTEKKYGEQFAGLVAKSDVDLRNTAMSAPEVAATADRIIDLIDTGKVITGAGANYRLQLAKALNLAGGTDSEKIANTEMLISSQARVTMGAIKTSNLGAGQGFTNADRDFLEKAEAGQITYDAKSIRRLAELSRRVAEASAEKWNKRVQQIPASALEGTGVTTEPVIVPKRSVMKNSGKQPAADQAPAGVDPSIWQYMTPEERKLWQK